MLSCLAHAVVVARDLDAATRRLATLLGRAPSCRGEVPDLGARVALFGLANTVLTLAAPGPAPGPLAARLEADGEGLAALAFGSDDAEACRARLAGRDVAPGAVTRSLLRDLGSGAFRSVRRLDLSPERTRGVPLAIVEPERDAAPLPPAGLLGDEAGAVAALDHVVIRTGDPDAARDLYGEGLGLRLSLDRRFDAFGVRLLFFRVGGVTVELAAPLPAAGSAPPEAGPDRLWGLSYRVPDADAARARLLAAGFDVSEVREGRRPGTRVATVRGEPLGVATLILEVSPPDRSGPA